MRLKALDRLFLCDGCGELHTYSAETSVTHQNRDFCSLACAEKYDRDGTISVFRCWACAKELASPVPAWELRISGYMATFCDFDCRNRTIPRTRNRNWDCDLCDKPFVGAAGIYRLPDGTGAYCSAACRDIAQAKHGWQTTGEVKGRMSKARQSELRCSWCNSLIEGIGYCHSSLPGQYCSDYLACVNAALGALDEGRESRQSGWTSVDERLPEFDTPVLICIGGIPNQLNGPRVKAGLYLASLYGETGKEHLHRWGLQSSGFVSFECVTHWQPLPEPPIVEQARAFGFCKDCRHWGCSSTIYGRCDVLSQYQEAHGWIHTDGPIGTRFNFGCVAFLPREGEE